MSVREGLLALLAEQPRNGHQLKLEFEFATGAVWPLNVGQVYTTLERLERDGLVAGSARTTTRPCRSGTSSPPPGARSYPPGGRWSRSTNLRRATS